MTPAHAPLRLVLLDSDVVLQIQISGFYPVLAELSRQCQLQFIVTEPVKDEILNQFEKQPKFRALSEQTHKAFRKELLMVFNLQFAINHFGTAARSRFESYLNRGESLRERIDTGEAYTHAAAFEFDILAVSNDYQATRVLDSHQTPYRTPVLQTFDLYCLAVQKELMSFDSAHNCLGLLSKAGEYIPGQFKKVHFSDGYGRFQTLIHNAGLT